MSEHGIVEQAALPRARTLYVTSIKFSGEKQGTAHDGGFQFDWDGLGPGLWALVSDRNSRGKSSVLNVVRAALRGDFPGSLKSDVWRWLTEAEVQFRIDSTLYSCKVTKPSGNETGSASHAVLARKSAGRWVELYAGPAGADLEAQTEAVLMEELGFRPFHAFNKKEGAGHTHGWPAISSALFISEPGSAIFGHLKIDAMPLRLLQLFIGLPWVSTYTAAATALKAAVHAEEKRSARSKRGSGHIQSRKASVSKTLATAEARLARLPDRSSLRTQLLQLDQDAASTLMALTTERRQLQALVGRRDGAVDALKAAQREMQWWQDEQAAGTVFRRLRPVCCPACETGIESQRYEQSESACGLCGKSAAPDEVTPDRSARLQENVDDAQETASQLEEAVTKTNARVAELTRAVDAIQARTTEVQGVLATTEDAAGLELQIAALRGVVDELDTLLNAERDEGSAPDEEEVAVLRAAQDVTKEAIAAMQDDILDELSTALTAFMQQLGVENVESARIDGAGRLSVMQGGSKTFFTKLSSGERLRVRVSAALAVLKVARRRGHGRYPGILVLDSPGAQEMAEEDFAVLLGSVRDALEDSPDLQVFVGTVMRPELRDVLVPESTIHAENDGFLF